MSEEIKMSDVFGLPLVACTTNPQMITAKPTINGKVGHHSATIRSPNYNEITFAAHAINNHDRLVEENKRLREALKATIKSSWGVINSDDEDFLEKVDLHKNLEGELSRAEELLSEIGGDL